MRSSQNSNAGAERGLPNVEPVSEPQHVGGPRAVYDASADAYVRFVGVEISAATEGSIDRALLYAFVDMASAANSGRIADIGCGPGRVAAFLARLGVDVVGFDVSTAMLDNARIAHPAITFEQGQLDAVPVPDASLIGAVCWYSIIYTPPELLNDAFLELRRTLVSGGYLLLAFQAGRSEDRHRPDAHGTGLPLTSYLHDPDVVATVLSDAGLQLHTRAVRQAEFAHETSPQAFLIARALPA